MKICEDTPESLDVRDLLLWYVWAFVFVGQLFVWSMVTISKKGRLMFRKNIESNDDNRYSTIRRYSTYDTANMNHYSPPRSLLLLTYKRHGKSPPLGNCTCAAAAMISSFRLSRPFARGCSACQEGNPEGRAQTGPENQRLILAPHCFSGCWGNALFYPILRPSHLAT